MGMLFRREALECGDGSLYTGITTDIKRRMKEHQGGRGAHYTAWKGVKRLLYSEPQNNRSTAQKREAVIKRWPRQKKLKLIQFNRGQE